MYLIVGLGNPEPEYSYTRHNMGFDVINVLAQKNNINVEKKGFKSIYGCGVINNEKVILVKPQTYMNLSGEAIKELVNYYKIDFQKLIIVYDDIDLEAGTVKIRKKGGPGSHNGMKSVVYNLNTDEFPHIRIGTGKPENKNDLINYVISKLSKDEYNTLSNAINTGAKAVEEILDKGIDIAMNIINKGVENARTNN